MELSKVIGCPKMGRKSAGGLVKFSPSGFVWDAFCDLFCITLLYSRDRMAKVNRPDGIF